MDQRDLLAVASATFRDRIVCVGDGQWSHASTCDEWSVRDIVDHVVGGNRFAARAVEGLSLEVAFAEALAAGFDGNPVVLFSESADEQLSAFGMPDALDRTVDHPMGPINGLDFLGFRICDLVIHSWDVARSTGGVEEIDDSLTEFVWSQIYRSSGILLASGSYGSPQRPTDTQPRSRMDEVLLSAGRTP